MTQRDFLFVSYIICTRCWFLYCGCWSLKWKSLSHVQLCNPMHYTVHRILQARILEWVAFPFSRGSSQPRDWTQVSRIAGGCFTSWATREAPSSTSQSSFLTGPLALPPLFLLLVTFSQSRTSPIPCPWELLFPFVHFLIIQQTFIGSYFCCRHYG